MEKSAAMRDGVQEEGVAGEGADVADDDNVRSVLLLCHMSWGVSRRVGSRWEGRSSTFGSRRRRREGDDM